MDSPLQGGGGVSTRVDVRVVPNVFPEYCKPSFRRIAFRSRTGFLELDETVAISLDGQSSTVTPPNNFAGAKLEALSARLFIPGIDNSPNAPVSKWSGLGLATHGHYINPPKGISGKLSEVLS